MNGNITKDGIRKDLEWMSDNGVVGFHNFDAGLETPQIIDKRVVYMAPEWKDAFRYAIDLADSLDMEVTIASSPGWSETGGPWVKLEDGMKKLVWRHFDIEGGRKVSCVLPEGFKTIGEYQDIPTTEGVFTKEMLEEGFYRDIAVIGVKVPEDEMIMERLQPKVTTSGGTLTLEQLVDDKVNDYTTISPDKDGSCWVQLEFDEPVTVRSVVEAEAKSVGDRNALTRELQSSNDGIHFKTVKVLGYQRCLEKTYAVPETTAKYFRLRMKSTEKGHENDSFGVSKLVLSNLTRIQDAGDKAGNGMYRLLYLETTPESNHAARLEDVVDLTSFVRDGVLEWDAPEGTWRIFRFGFGLTGKMNHPATREATGLEVDKLDPKAIRDYLNNYLETYVDASGNRMGPGGIEYLLTDSYEAGSQTWTWNMREEFQNRRGYDVFKWLPALTGMLLDSTNDTERFLFDWRMAIGEMIAEYHYDQQNEVLKDYGMKRYTESHENYKAHLADGMDCKKYAEVPMSAFWMGYNQGMIFNPRFCADIRESASVAHIYGQNINAAESFTSDGYRDGGWVFSPAILKPTADAAMASGLNRFVIHTSPHQPVDDKFPGLGLGKYGQWFDRHQTWADQAKVWTNYLSRSCYMLQQGQFVADVAIYYGEDNNITGIYRSDEPFAPRRYNYDYFSPSILLDLAKVEDGKLTVPSGMTYEVLYLGVTVKYMSMKVLRRIAELADAGVTICGYKPDKLASHDGTNEEFRTLVDYIWNSGRKNVSTNKDVEAVLRSIDVEPDFDVVSGSQDSVRFVHRHLDNGEIYWVTNLSTSKKDLVTRYRVSGKKPIVWSAEDLSENEAKAYSIKDGHTDIKLSLTQHESVFVLFMEDTDVTEKVEVFPAVRSLVASIDTPWTVEFQKDRGAPERVTFPDLHSWTEYAQPGIRYFSGHATYTNSFSLNGRAWRMGRIVLDLGDVKDLAEVTVNGQKVGVYWNAPYTADISDFVKKGVNKVEIKVYNMWHNRLVGDVQPDAKEKIAWTAMQFFQADEPLLKAGLIGPVKVYSETPSVLRRQQKL